MNYSYNKPFNGVGVTRAVAGKLRGGPESELVFNAVKQEQNNANKQNPPSTVLRLCPFIA